MTPEWKWVFRLNETRFSFGVIWKCAFRCNETLIFDIRTSKKKTWKKSVFFWILCHVRNLRAPPFSLNATRSRSKSAHSTYFHMWHLVATYSCTGFTFDCAFCWSFWGRHCFKWRQVESICWVPATTLSCPTPPPCSRLIRLLRHSMYEKNGDITFGTPSQGAVSTACQKQQQQW